MYSLSTCWNSHRHTDGRAMLREIRELGFEYAELSHGIRISLMPGILEAVGAGEIKISSLHNFCPLPMGVSHAAPNLYQFSDERPRQRELAIKHTLKTFEFAGRVNAPVVVLHLGSMDLKDYTGKLCAMLERGQQATPKYEKLCAEASKMREARKERFVENVYDTLRKILLAPRLAGFHVHDVIFPAGDHAAPGTGMIDYAALKPFVKPEHIKVFELSPSLPVEAVKSGIAHVKTIWGNE